MKVTSTTAPVVPAPHYPPLQGFPSLPPSRVPPVAPDIRVLVPEAPAQAVIISKIEDQRTERRAPEDIVVTPVVTGWKPADLFFQWSKNAGGQDAYPSTDSFTLYLMATIARYAYGYGSDAGLRANEALTSVLGAKGYTVWHHQQYPLVKYGVWTLADGAKIMAFPGTQKIAEWFGYTPSVQSTPNIWPADWYIYGPFSAAASTYFDLTRNAGTGIAPDSPPVVMTGHSIGGTVAQLVAGDANHFWEVANPTKLSAYPVRSFWSFGAPYWLARGWTTMRESTLKIGCRVVVSGDPVPEAPNVALLSRTVGLRVDRGLLSNLTVLANRLEPHAHRAVTYYPESASDLSKIRNAGMRALVSGGAELTLMLMDRHSIGTYTRLAAHYCKPTPRVSQGLIDQLNTANAAMDSEDWGLGNVSG